MAEQLKNIFDLVDPPEALFELISGKISFAERTRQKRKLFLILSLLALSLAVSVFLVIIFYYQVVEVGLDKILYLIFSDGRIVIQYWQDYFLYILEVLPVIWLILVLTVVVVSLEMIRLSINNFFKYKLFLKNKFYGQI